MRLVKLGWIVRLSQIGMAWSGSTRTVARASAAPAWATTAAVAMAVSLGAAWAQVPSVAVETRGWCSPGVAAGRDATVTVICGFTDEQVGRAIAAATVHLHEASAAERRQFEEFRRAADVTEEVARGILRDLGQRGEVPRTELADRLAGAVARWRRLSEVVARVGSDDPGIRNLRRALEQGDIDTVEGAILALETRLASQAAAATAAREATRASLRETFDQIRKAGVPAGGVFHADLGWSSGAMLRFCFEGGDAALRRHVADVARQWTLYANVDFDFGLAESLRDCAEAQGGRDLLRIALTGTGFWAYLGTTARRAQGPHVSLPIRPQPWTALERAEADRMILHEFGHVLGFTHNINHPGAGCGDQVDWAAAEAYERVTGQHGFTEALRRLLLGSPSGVAVRAGRVDPVSVMTYALPPQVFRAGAAADCAHTPSDGLSIGDKLAAAEAYP